MLKFELFNNIVDLIRSFLIRYLQGFNKILFNFAPDYPPLCTHNAWQQFSDVVAHFF